MIAELCMGVNEYLWSTHVHVPDPGGSGYTFVTAIRNKPRREIINRGEKLINRGEKLIKYSSIESGARK